MATLVDTHAHLTMDAFREDLDRVLERALESGVSKILTVGVDWESSCRAVELAARHDCVFAAAGVHPHDAREADGELLRRLLDLWRHPDVVAAGEMGLDYHYDFSPRDRQQGVFRTQLLLAREAGIPVIIHVREAMRDALAIIDSVSAANDWKGVFHCFSGDEGDVREVVQRGFHVSFTGMVTFKNFHQEDAVRAVPAERLLLETDAPYMAPVPNRGKRCEPAWIRDTQAAVARIRGDEPESLGCLTSANAAALFGLDVNREESS